MELTDENVKYIAHLSRLNISDSEIKDYKQNLTEILTFVEQMSSCDTEGVTAKSLPLHPKQKLREDRVTESDQRDVMQTIAPETEAGLYLVPQVIE